jgi:hypothetical protein
MNLDTETKCFYIASMMKALEDRNETLSGLEEII